MSTTADEERKGKERMERKSVGEVRRVMSSLTSIFPTDLGGIA